MKDALILKLRKYFALAQRETVIKKKDLLANTESLKAFGKLWSDNNPDMMTMLAAIEYEYISEHHYTKDQIKTLKTVLGKVALFFRGCSDEWKEFEAEQAKREKQ